jgi:transcriptional regulator with XRE-family HTH domain
MSEVKWMDEFGYHLKKQLEYAWMTRAELAEVTGISLATICRYISGQQKPSVTNVINIARALDCDIDTLVNFEEDIR